MRLNGLSSAHDKITKTFCNIIFVQINKTKKKPRTMATYQNRGLGNWGVTEIGDRSQTSLMARAEQRISSSCQHLEATFKDINRDYDAPCPVKLVRRLTVLEIALGQLKQDCEMISAKRKSIVESVIADQNANVDHLQEVGESNSVISKEKSIQWIFGFDSHFSLNLIMIDTT